MHDRLKIQLQPSPFDKLLERAGLVFVFILWGITVYSYFSLPKTIPTHFNFSGQPDSYGSKAALFVLPALGTLIYWGITALNKRPHIFNYPVTITAENAGEQYGYFTRMLRILKTSVVLILIFIVAVTFLTAKGKMAGFGPWVLPCIMAFLLLPVGYYIVRSFKEK